ncbi:hypothetical protein HGRIS_007529 [Hohenbuehelia grisea]|uniref:Spc7 kinetochore protein domain-containing protein n=1 Tax=Hohenbuehelia grisea TaxID=104357 RepID=A0ABR3J553_9AGAR
MAVQKRSPNRRKSVAVVSDQNRPPFIQRTKRRAHSDRLSPLAKARRNIAPRKSILKQSSQENSQDDNATQSMDLTTDFRKSLGRRVSFAKNAKVRLFEVPDNHTSSTNASGSPPSSPASPAEDNQPRAVSDENAYPGAAPRDRRRSSARFSVAGSDDMDLTTIHTNPFGFSGPADPNASLGFGSDSDEDMADDDAMEVTEAIHGNIIRRRSISIGGQRHPLALLSSAPPAAPQSPGVHPDESAISMADASQDDANDTSHSSSSDGSAVPMEFTIPLAQSLKPPAHHDEAWLALRAATHSGGEPYQPPEDSFEDEGAAMLEEGPRAHHATGDGELDDAVQRIMRARASLPNAPTIPLEPEVQEDAFTDDSGSFSADFEEGNQTLNLSKVMGRPSMTNAFEESMEGTSVYGQIFNSSLPVESTPTIPRAQYPIASPPSPEPPVEEPAVPPIPPPAKAPIPLSSVFQPPPRQTVFQAPTTSTSKPPAPAPHFSFKPKPSGRANSPTKPDPPAAKPQTRTFSAAFAPPVTRPSPKKPRLASESTTDAPAAQVQPLNKSNQLGQAGGAASKPSILRRPSGYFSRRQSMGAGVTPTPSSAEFNAADEPESAPKPASPKKKSGLGIGHAGLAVGVTDARIPLAQDQAFRLDKGKEKENPGIDAHTSKEQGASGCVREASRQAMVAHSPTRGSPAPRQSPRPRSPAPARSRPEVEDISSLVQGGLGDTEMREDRGDEESNHREHHLPAEGDMEIEVANQDGATSGVKTAGMERWRNSVQQQDLADPNRQDLYQPSVSISEFFHMTGIKFMDEIAAPRRSMSQPARPERASADIPLAEYAIAAAIDVPRLVLYTRVADDLEAWMRRIRGVLAEMEREAQQATPELFVEYLSAEDEGKEELRHQLTLIRHNTRGLAKGEWYNWKLQWIAGLSETAARGLEDLEADKQQLEEITTRAEALVPTLEQEFADVMKELELEQAEVDDIEASDQEYLNELKASIAEQDIEVDALRTEVSESKAHLGRLQERLQEIEVQKEEFASAIASADRLLHTQKSSTTAEIFRLRDELEALEDLHMFRAVKVAPDSFDYVYASRFSVSIPCQNYQPIPGKVYITKLDNMRYKYKDDYPQLADFFLQVAAARINQMSTRTVRQIVRALANHWNACLSLRAQIDLLSVKYPVKMLFRSDAEGAVPGDLQARTMVIFPKAKAKAYISFVVPADVAASWPASIEGLQCDVEVAYGSIKADAILESIRGRLAEATPDDCHACLLDACIGAQELYL